MTGALWMRSTTAAHRLGWLRPFPFTPHTPRILHCHLPSPLRDTFPVLSLSSFSTSSSSSSSSSTSAFSSTASSATGDSEATLCPPPLRHIYPPAPDSALFKKYVQCLDQRVVDPSLPPLPTHAPPTRPAPSLSVSSSSPSSSSSSSSFSPSSMDSEIFANQDCPLQHVTWYGFDFDFTLASYNDALGHLIYEEAKFHLIQRLGYPRELGRCAFDPAFAIRGLHFDDRTGFLLKLDQFGKIQLDTVHRGRQKVRVDDIVEQYHGITVNREYEEEHLHSQSQPSEPEHRLRPLQRCADLHVRGCVCAGGQ